jgi:hypothetical protein
MRGPAESGVAPARALVYTYEYMVDSTKKLDYMYKHIIAIVFEQHV